MQRGESILIVSAGGGVNLASLHIAKYLGAKVIVVGSNITKLKRVEELGADESIDCSRDVDWAKAVYSLTNKRGVDVVVDNVGAGTLLLSLRAASKGGAFSPGRVLWEDGVAAVGDLSICGIMRRIGAAQDCGATKTSEVS